MDINASKKFIEDALIGKTLTNNGIDNNALRLQLFEAAKSYFKFCKDNGSVNKNDNPHKRPLEKEFISYIGLMGKKPENQQFENLTDDLVKAANKDITISEYLPELPKYAYQIENIYFQHCGKDHKELPKEALAQLCLYADKIVEHDSKNYRSKEREYKLSDADKHDKDSGAASSSRSVKNRLRNVNKKIADLEKGIKDSLGFVFGNNEKRLDEFLKDVRNFTKTNGATIKSQPFDHNVVNERGFVRV